MHLFLFQAVIAFLGTPNESGAADKNWLPKYRILHKYYRVYHTIGPIFKYSTAKRVPVPTRAALEIYSNHPKKYEFPIPKSMQSPME